MLSDSARNTTATESRFRIQAPNAAARGILVVALDRAGAGAIADLKDEDWCGVRFADVSRWRSELQECATDVVVIVSGADQSAEAAREIGRYALERSIDVSAVLLRSGADVATVSRSLWQLRPWTRTLTLLEDNADLRGVLHALGG